jgi:hypothetical protein
MPDRNKPASNNSGFLNVQESLNTLGDAERRIILLIRKLDLYDKVEIKYSERGKLQWQLTRTSRGDYNDLR